jgi:hypothetical protein
MVCLATAHPAKFPETVSKAIGQSFKLPEEVERLKYLPQRVEVLPNDVEMVKAYLARRAIL